MYEQFMQNALLARTAGLKSTRSAETEKTAFLESPGFPTGDLDENVSFYVNKHDRFPFNGNP